MVSTKTRLRVLANASAIGMRHVVFDPQLLSRLQQAGWSNKNTGHPGMLLHPRGHTILQDRDGWHFRHGGLGHIAVVTHHDLVLPTAHSVDALA